MKEVFPDAIHLRCFNHFRKNIEKKLRSLNFTDKAAKEILRDIFGLVIENEHQLGLVDSKNEADFRQKLDAVKQKWDEMELEHRLCHKDEVIEAEFHKWFVQEKASTMISCMLSDIRQKAGMGNSPDHFYTNLCESMNNILRNRTDFKPHDVRPFVTKMYNLVEAQDSLFRKAVIRSDRWRFRQKYHHLEVDQDKWFTMNEQAQKKHLQRVYAEPLSSILEVSDKEDTSSSSSVSMNLSVPYKELINSYRIATSTLEDIWKKGIHLYSTPGLVTTVPGHSADSNSRMVASLTSGEPHFITEKKSGQFLCKGLCPRFSSYKICQHVVAAAELWSFATFLYLVEVTEGPY